MIKVNLADTSSRKLVPGAKSDTPTNLLPIVLVLIMVGSAIGGSVWWYRLSARNTVLADSIVQLEIQKAQLETVIQQNMIFETRKKALESRIKIIEDLKRNQVSPVVSLDVLSEAVSRTQYVWLSNFDQNNAIFSMSGTGTSYNAIADFVTNLQATGFFRNINLVNAQTAAGNFTFSMSCEFSPPAAVTREAIPSLGGAN